MMKLIAIIITGLVFSTSALASGGHHHPGRGKGYSKHYYQPKHRVKRYRPVERVYYREEVHYYPQRVTVYETVPRYMPAPAYAPAPRYNSYDQRSTQGLVGGAVGSMLGYEIGRGDPIASGIGAAAGSLLGNELGRR